MKALGQGEIKIEFQPMGKGKPTAFGVFARDHYIWLTYEQAKEAIWRYDQMMAAYRGLPSTDELP